MQVAGDADSTLTDYSGTATFGCCFSTFLFGSKKLFGGTRCTRLFQSTCSTPCYCIRGNGPRTRNNTIHSEGSGAMGDFFVSINNMPSY